MLQLLQHKAACAETISIQKQLEEPATRRALTITCGLAAVTQLSGAPTLLTVLQSALGMSGTMSLVCLGFTVLLACLVNPALTTYCGYRKSLICAFVAMATSLVS